MTPSRDYCPKNSGGHRFSDYSYWGEKHPQCDLCDFVDESREVGELARPLTAPGLRREHDHA